MMEGAIPLMKKTKTKKATEAACMPCTVEGSFFFFLFFISAEAACIIPGMQWMVGLAGWYVIFFLFSNTEAVCRRSIVGRWCWYWGLS